MTTMTGLMLLVPLLLPPAIQGGSVNEVVAAFYPPWLQDLSDRAKTGLDRQQCFAIYDTSPAGPSTTIIAAYTNGLTAAVRVLRWQAGSTSVADEPRHLDLTGTRCAIELIDIEADGRREAHLMLSSDMQTTHWVFQWDGQRLTNLTPVATDPLLGLQSSKFFNGEFVDLDTDGRLEFYGGGSVRSREGEPMRPAEVWRFSAGGFVPGEPLVAANSFKRTAGSPEIVRVRVPLPAGAQGPFTLEVRNGDARGSARVTSGRIWINDREVVSPGDFGEKVSVIERPVQLGAHNEVAVRLAGAPGSRIQVTIRSAVWSQGH